MIPDGQKLLGTHFKAYFRKSLANFLYMHVFYVCIHKFISTLIFISFFLSIFILSSLLITDNIGFERSFKLSVLTLTNTVNSELYSLQNFNFANLLISTKLSLIIFMIIGKIELISVFLIFKKLLFKN